MLARALNSEERAGPHRLTLFDRRDGNRGVAPFS